jgi:hypothetical protein
MDDRTLEDGITWKEFYQVIKEKVKVDAYSPYDSRLVPYKRVDDVTWMDLFLTLIEERSFFGLKRDPGKTMSILKVLTSKKVLDCFFERAWDKPILKSRNNVVIDQ